MLNRYGRSLLNRLLQRRFSEPFDEFIYRPAERGPKDFTLHRNRDYLTGLSFLNNPYTMSSLRFSVRQLREEGGYIVVNDGGQIARLLPFFNGLPYQDPYAEAGETITLDDGHYTLYHPDWDYWKSWHEADAANLYTPRVSEQVLRLYRFGKPV